MGTVLPEPMAKEDFVLTATDGTPFDFRKETDGYLTFLFFGYTHCPDVCPVHMANLGAVLERLDPVSASKIKVVFVSTDPERDSLERIRSWLDRFDRSFIGLRGDIGTVNRIQESFGIPKSIKGKTDQRGEYQVGHAAYVVAFTADNQGRVLYPFGTRQSDWAHDIPLLLELNVPAPVGK